MACEFEIIVADGRDQNEIVDIANLALDEVEQLDSELSCFRPTSEVSFVNAEAAQRPIMVGPDLFEILRAAKEVWWETDGAFDVTAGPLIDLWRSAEQTGTAPDKQAIDEALARVGMSRVVLDEHTHSVQFDTGQNTQHPEPVEGSLSVPSLRINLGAIGKGYAVRKAASILREYDVGSALVSGGGSTIFGFGDGPDGDGWRVGIRHPSKLDERVTEIVLRGQAMSTSGGPAHRDKDVEENFEHIIDPATGEPAMSEAASVSVIADDAMLSDALATAFYLRGRELATRYCAAHPGTRAVFVAPDGQTIE